ncbi:MAG: LegC family aminotransferase [Chitinophagaceae bacterium]|jgi:perosamine synthetase|nr:LegC family aminotransferase [Chitinophagaceae bacterium]MBP6045609.1 LegC family aminotransferase [Ferruginibacter sp.]NMD29861.1 LegC family aminotransferase [Bacteroidota bacterium]MBK7089136.1 LegC family aminotransferase [Chitinophagaceae bacterium]MBK7347699.1 LegC family aminotransferase [Chitinophagaceae bacterium]
MLLLSGPNMGGNELKYVSECIETGWVSSVGAYVDKFEKLSAEFAGTQYAVATSSGTTALHTCLVMLGVTASDYVIAPNITFIATCNSIKYTGAGLILIDADEFNWQMDLNLLQEFLENETEQKNGECFYKKNGRRIPVIMPVHVLGNICDMDRLMALAKKHNLVVLEDSTEALGSYYKGKHAGSFGIMGTFSYNGNKIITTGGGGMIVTHNEAFAKKAKHLTTQAKSDPFEYIHDEIGYNYRLVNVAAAMGVAQMEQLPGFLKRKKEIIAFYKNELNSIADISWQQVNDDVNPNWWLPTIKTTKQRQVLKLLNDAKMQSRPFWVPMNQLRMFKDEIYYHKTDRSDFIYTHCLSIPCSTNITQADLKAVADKIKEAY